MKCRFLLLTAAVLGATTMRGNAADLVEIRLNGHFFSEPATLRITIAVEPDKANRTLRIEADGEVVGAIGASGGNGEQDMAVCEAGLAAFERYLAETR